MPTYLNSSNTLDLVRTKDPGSIFNLQVLEPFLTSDHASVIFDKYFYLSTSNIALNTLLTSKKEIMTS